MEKYQKRMIKEFKELCVKIQKLDKWLSKEKNLRSVTPEMSNAMFDQQEAMHKYRNAMFERIRLMGLAGEVSEPLPHLEMNEVIETDQGEKYRCIGYSENGEPIMEVVY